MSQQSTRRGLDRRDFLRTSALAGLGVGLRPRLAGARPAPGIRRSVRLGRTGLEVSDIGFGGEAFWQHRNFFGNGERLQLSLTGAQIEQQVDANFGKPEFLGPDQALLADLPLSYLHVFRYSARPKTLAAKAADPVPAPVASARSAELRRLSDRLRTSTRRRSDNAAATETGGSDDSESVPEPFDDGDGAVVPLASADTPRPRRTIVAAVAGFAAGVLVMVLSQSAEVTSGPTGTPREVDATPTMTVTATPIRMKPMPVLILWMRVVCLRITTVTLSPT